MAEKDPRLCVAGNYDFNDLVTCPHGDDGMISRRNGVWFTHDRYLYNAALLETVFAKDFARLSLDTGRDSGIFVPTRRAPLRRLNNPGSLSPDLTILSTENIAASPLWLLPKSIS